MNSATLPLTIAAVALTIAVLALVTGGFALMVWVRRELERRPTREDLARALSRSGSSSAADPAARERPR